MKLYTVKLNTNAVTYITSVDATDEEDAVTRAISRIYADDGFDLTHHRFSSEVEEFIDN